MVKKSFYKFMIFSVMFSMTYATDMLQFDHADLPSSEELVRDDLLTPLGLFVCNQKDLQHSSNSGSVEQQSLQNQASHVYQEQPLYGLYRTKKNCQSLSSELKKQKDKSYSLKNRVYAQRTRDLAKEKMKSQEKALEELLKNTAALRAREQELLTENATIEGTIRFCIEYLQANQPSSI